MENEHHTKLFFLLLALVVMVFILSFGFFLGDHEKSYRISSVSKEEMKMVVNGEMPCPVDSCDVDGDGEITYRDEQVLKR